MNTGVDHLEYEHFGLPTPTSEIICTRREPGEPTAYCGKGVPTDYHPDNHKDRSGRSRYMQHCLPCDKAYRIENDGRCATTV